MSTIITLISIGCLIAALVGVFKPSLVLPAKINPSTLKALGIYVSVFFIMAFIGGTLLSHDPNWQARQEKERADRAVKEQAARETAETEKRVKEEAAAKDKSIHGVPKVGEVYRVFTAFPAPFNDKDCDEVTKRLRSDPGSLAELLLQRRINLVPAGAQVKVIDRKGFIDVWVQCRRIDEPSFRTFWIYANALERL
jgi:hypothetical protein